MLNSIKTGELIKGIKEKKSRFKRRICRKFCKWSRVSCYFESKPSSNIGSEKNFKDTENNEIEVYHSKVNGWVAITGDVYENHSQLDSNETSKQFIDYFHKNYKPKMIMFI